MIWRGASAPQVRAAIAHAWLGAQPVARLGTVVLHPHQRATAARLRAMLQSARGALLADPVGLGKTYSALAAARGAAHLVVVAPAALRAMWTQAATATGVGIQFASFQALSRGCVPDAADFVIVDEAHHARNPATKRYRALAALCARPPVLLLSATPVHNRVADLRAELALFLGERAWTMPECDLASFVVKRDADECAPPGGAADLPRVETLQWVNVGDDTELLEQIVTLPPPLPARAGGDGGALLATTLVRQWASSRAALAAALRRRLAQATALTQALRSGRYPSRAELRAWCYADGALQLAFPELATDAVASDAATLLGGAERHAAGVAGLLHRLSCGADPDDARAAALRRLRLAHPDTRIVVFAEFAATVASLYARLQAQGGVAMLTTRGGVVAGGRVTRAELLAQFAPGGATPVPDARRVSVLITTDLLSEGVNLQEADVVVHADLPWSPARFEQRVGRVRRLASRHAAVFVYALRPPAPADRLLRMERRLRAKVAAAARVVGVRGTIMPRLLPGGSPDAPPALRADAGLTDVVNDWWRADAPATNGDVLVAAARAQRAGLLAIVARGDHVELVADAGRGLTDARDAVLDTARLAAGPDVPLDARCVESALARIAAWLEERESMGVFDLACGGAARARRRLLHRIDAIASRSPRHLRGRYLPLARDARRAATSTFGTGAERVLQELAAARMPDEAWLSAVRTFAGLHARDATGHAPPVVRALLLLVPTSAAAGPPP